MELRNYEIENHKGFPVSGGGTALVKGSLLKRGATPGTMNGHLRLAAGNNAAPDAIGILKEAHATADDTDVAGTIFKTHPIDLLVPFRIVRIRYDLTAANAIACTQAVSTTTMTVSSLEDDIDACFVYVVAGTGIGQINYATASAAGALTLKAAFGTNLDTTSKFIKILPRFHQKASLSSDGTKLASQDAVGNINVIVLDTFIIRDGNEKQLNPVTDSAFVNLDDLASLQFEADVAIRDTIPYSID